MEAWKGRVRVLWTDDHATDEDIYSCIVDFAHFSFFFGGERHAHDAQREARPS